MPACRASPPPPRPGQPVQIEVPELGLTIQLNDAFDEELDNLANRGGHASNELHVGMTGRRAMRTAVTNALELGFQVGWSGEDRDRITLRLPSARLADLDRDLAAADIASAPEAGRCLALSRRAALEVARIGAYVETMEDIFGDAVERLSANGAAFERLSANGAAFERLSANGDAAHAPDPEKIVFLARAALVRTALSRTGARAARPGHGGILAPRSVPAMRDLLLDLAREGRLTGAAS